MLIVNRMSLPSAYAPKEGDLLRITKMESNAAHGRWYFDVELVSSAIPKEVLAFLGHSLSGKQFAEFMLWVSTGKLPAPPHRKERG